MNCRYAVLKQCAFYVYNGLGHKVTAKTDLVQTEGMFGQISARRWVISTNSRRGEARIRHSHLLFSSAIWNAESMKLKQQVWGCTMNVVAELTGHVLLPSSCQAVAWDCGALVAGWQVGVTLALGGAWPVCMQHAGTPVTPAGATGEMTPQVFGLTSWPATPRGSPQRSTGLAQPKPGTIRHRNLADF